MTISILHIFFFFFVKKPKKVYIFVEINIFLTKIHIFTMKKTIVKKQLTDLHIAPIDATQSTKIKGGKTDRNGFIIDDDVNGI